MSEFQLFLYSLMRKKTYTDETMERSELSRRMNIFDLTLLGVGTSLGLGAYVLAGEVARELAGPATVLSFVIAGVASVFAALCYAEFASRVPRAGSAYVYSYVSVGEILAFVIGWDMILEYLIGNATLARGVVSYLDGQTGQHLENMLNSTMHMSVEYMAPFPDFFACLLIFIMSCLMAVGVKESSIFNDVFSVLNLLTLLTVIIAGSFKADTANWKIPKDQIPDNVNGGEGGFFPFGFDGVKKGAAQCFFGFVGFDSVAAAGEETINPQRNVPIAIWLSVSIVLFVYVSISTVLTMMWPYYLQDLNAPLPYVFHMVGWEAVRWIVTVGAVCALITSMLGGMYPPPRIIYSMASDGLLFKFMSKVYPKTKTPIISIAVAAVISGILTLLFDLQDLVEMLSIGTLLAYSIVAICVLRLRYEDSEMEADDMEVAVRDAGPRGNCLRGLDYLFNLNRKKKPTRKTVILVRVAVWLFCLFQAIFNAILSFASLDLWVILIVVAIGLVMVLLLVIVGLQPHTTSKLLFRAPQVPVLPAISIVMNFHLMLQLKGATWVRLTVWMLIGIVIYFAYGYKNSVEGIERKQKLQEGNPNETPPK